MCIPNTLQHNILEGPKGGYDIATFLADTMRGETPGVRVNHRLEAAKHLVRYGFPDAQPDLLDRHSREGMNPERNVESPVQRTRVRAKETAKPITYLDILNYEIAHLIRSETAEGHTIVNFLVDIMTGRDRPFTPKKLRIKPADRMAAARELLRRGFGDFGSRRKPQENSCAEASETSAQGANSQTPTTKQTPTTPCTPISPSECASTASAAQTPFASCSK